MSILTELSFIDQNSCPLCQCDHFKRYDEVPDRLTKEINRYLPLEIKPLQQITNIRQQCRSCGLIFLSPRLCDESLSLIYHLWYRYGYRLIFDNDQYIAQRLYEFKRYHLNTLKQVSPQTGRLLDVGCGNGLFLKVAREAGWQGIGVEFDRHTAEDGIHRFQIDIRNGIFSSNIHFKEPFDVITMFDYLEHSTTPSVDLQLALDLLKPGGTLLIRVPNQAGWQSRLMGRHWIALISNHLSYFSPTVITNFLNRLGAEVVLNTADNYQTQYALWKNRFRWLKSRIHRQSSNLGDEGRSLTRLTESASLRNHKISLRKINRLMMDVLVEQLDYLAGLTGNSNYLMIAGRKRV